MTNVVDLKQARTERGPRNEGPARCLRCDHRWNAVTPVGTVVNLECPGCHAMMGTMLLHVRPPGHEPVLTCQCGNQHFLITPRAVFCLNCGTAKPIAQ